MTDLLELSDLEDIEVTIEEFGEHGEQVLVLDNFYREPDRVRELAIAQQQWTPQRLFPGIRAHVPFDTGPFFANLMQFIDIAGIRPDSDCDGKLVFSVTTQRDADVHRLNAELPHYDQGFDVAGLVYLNLPAQCRGGTAFYRHRTTGEARWNYNLARQRQLLATLGISTEGMTDNDIGVALWRYYFDPPCERPRRYIRGSNEVWEMTKLVDMKYNRAVFYETDLFHAMYVADDYFGDDAVSGRLTQTMFLRVDREDH